MNKKRIAIFLTLIMALMPFLGFPGSFKDIFFVSVGLLVAVLIQFSSVKYCGMCEKILDKKHEHKKIKVRVEKEGKKEDVKVSEIGELNEIIDVAKKKLKKENGFQNTINEIETSIVEGETKTMENKKERNIDGEEQDKIKVEEEFKEK